MANNDSCEESDVSAVLDRIEATYALKIQEYRALISLKSADTDPSSGSTAHTGTVRMPDVIYRPRRAA
jgi:hypothetical protein